MRQQVQEGHATGPPQSVTNSNSTRPAARKPTARSFTHEELPAQSPPTAKPGQQDHFGAPVSICIAPAEGRPSGQPATTALRQAAQPQQHPASSQGRRCCSPHEANARSGREGEHVPAMAAASGCGPIMARKYMHSRQEQIARQRSPRTTAGQEQIDEAGGYSVSVFIGPGWQTTIVSDPQRQLGRARTPSRDKTPGITKPAVVGMKNVSSPANTWKAHHDQPGQQQRKPSGVIQPSATRAGRRTRPGDRKSMLANLKHLSGQGR